MSVDGPGFHVDVDVLDAAGKGITQSVHDQETFALRGLCGDAELYGHAGVHNALADYCARWSAGLDTLIAGEPTYPVRARRAPGYADIWPRSRPGDRCRPR